MREMVQIVVLFGVVTAAGWSLTAGLDLLMGVQLVPMDEDSVLPIFIVRATHKAMYMAWGGAFVWLWHAIFRR